MCKKNYLLVLLITLYSFNSINAQQKKDSSKPNIIFILTDDQSYGMLGCTGNTVVQTPNIDKLASEGVLFTNAHVTSAICTPSRASILTGRLRILTFL